MERRYEHTKYENLRDLMLEDSGFTRVFERDPAMILITHFRDHTIKLFGGGGYSEITVYGRDKTSELETLGLIEERFSLTTRDSSGVQTERSSSETSSIVRHHNI